MNRAFLAVAFVLVLTGCEKPGWDKYQASKQDYATDHEACEKDARQNGYILGSIFDVGFANEFSWPSRYRECMTLKGWYQETKIWTSVSDMGN